MLRDATTQGKPSQEGNFQFAMDSKVIECSTIDFNPKSRIFYSYTIVNSIKYDKNIWHYKLTEEINSYSNDPYRILRSIKIIGVTIDFKRRKP
jgi:hypothetical protein